jgi:hypothetical protein
MSRQTGLIAVILQLQPRRSLDALKRGADIDLDGLASRF